MPRKTRNLEAPASRAASATAATCADRCCGRPWRARAADGKPFFLYLAYNAPHSPIEPPADQEEWQAAVTMRDATRDAILARTGEPDLVHERVLDRMADEARGKKVG